MSIEQNLHKVIADIEKDPSLSEKFRMGAIEAIYGGPGSDAWKNFLSQFATPGNAAELARLTMENDVPCEENAEYARYSRAYLIANFLCGTPTFTTTPTGVGDNLDQTLPANLHPGAVPNQNEG